MLSRTFEFIQIIKNLRLLRVYGIWKTFRHRAFFNGSYFRIDELIESALVNFKRKFVNVNYL